jgi:hypothetical protein
MIMYGTGGAAKNTKRGEPPGFGFQFPMKMPLVFRCISI